MRPGSTGRSGPTIWNFPLRTCGRFHDPAGGEWSLVRQGFIEDHAQRVDIAARIPEASLAFDGLRRYGSGCNYNRRFGHPGRAQAGLAVIDVPGSAVGT